MNQTLDPQAWPDRGMLVLRASRLESLLDPLDRLLRDVTPAHPLRRQQVIAAHPGIRDWLKATLAQRRGPTSIVANLDICLVWQWIDQQAKVQLDIKPEALKLWQRPHLRWHIDALLREPSQVEGLQDERLRDYLRQAQGAGAATLARRRFQMADRLAGLYSQYLVYRLDWLEAWEKGRDRMPDRDQPELLLAPLWRALRQRLGAHRGDRLRELRESFAADSDGDGDDGPLQVFGIAHLAPLELDLLKACSRRRLVVLHVPDPCREYWAGLARREDLVALAKRERNQIEQSGEASSLTSSSHPLLAAWGRMGQHFIMQLAELESLADIRHWQDQQSPLAQGLCLQRLQQSIRELDTSLLDIDLRDREAHGMALSDVSLRVHRCHTRLRELEVLHDQLLDALSGDDTLKPSDIVVMAPDIQAYLPLLASVFGSAARFEHVLPYHLHDVPVVRSHRLLGLFERLLDLPAMRLSAPEVLDLLGTAEVLAGLDLDQAGLERLSQWLSLTRVAWALDAEHRQQFEVPALSAQTFAWGMERLIGGYLMADCASEQVQPVLTLADGTQLQPVTGISAQEAAAIGALDALLRQIQILLDAADRELPASVWVTLLEGVLDALLRIDPRDGEARKADEQLRAIITGLREPLAEQGAETLDEPHELPLHFSVVRDLLKEGLGAVPEHQRMLLGGVTFCGMVPQRAVPFRVVAVLGLNDGEFPRPRSDGGLDLMARYARLGDRDPRSDDRYLFLETLMSARDRLHLSYIGEGARDGKPRNPASPLAELLTELERHAQLPVADECSQAIRVPWLLSHPLQAFDGRYFPDPKQVTDSRLFSFNHNARILLNGPIRQSSPADPSAGLYVHQTPQLGDAVWALSALQHYFRRPAEHLLSRQLKAELTALADSGLQDSELLDGSFLAMDTVARRVYLDHWLAQGCDSASAETQIGDAPLVMLKLAGKAPLGALAKAAWNSEFAKLTLLDQRHRQLAEVAPAWPGWQSQNIAPTLVCLGVQGKVDSLLARAGSPELPAGLDLLRAFPSGSRSKAQLKKESALHLGERIAIFLDWALTQLAQGPEQPLRVLLLCDEKGGDDWSRCLNDWSAAYAAANQTTRQQMSNTLREHIRQLTGFWQQAMQQTLWYFPRSTSAVITALRKARKQASGPLQCPDDHDIALCFQIHTKVREIWLGSDDIPGESRQDAGYASLLAGPVDFDIERYPQQLHALISNACFLENVLWPELVDSEAAESGS